MTMQPFDTFIGDYFKAFAAALSEFDQSPMQDVLSVFDKVRDAGGIIYIAGNGGSAGIADHSVCDVSKGTFVEGQRPYRMISLSANGPILTALGNDNSYDDVFSEQLKYYLTEKDALLVVSSSGNSANVVNACAYANKAGVPTMAFVGFQGGKLKEIAQHVVHVDVNNYGIVEDIHQSLIHCLTQYLKARALAA